MLTGLEYEYNIYQSIRSFSSNTFESNQIDMQQCYETIIIRFSACGLERNKL